MNQNTLLFELSEKYNKTNIEKGLLPFVKKYYHEFGLGNYINPDIRDVLIKVNNKKLLTKQDLVLLCFPLFANEEIYKKFLTVLPPQIKKLIEILLWVEEMSVTEIEKILKEPITEMPSLHSFSHDKKLKNEYYFFTVTQSGTYTYGRQTPSFIISLHPIFKQILMPYYPKPANYNFVPLTKIPDNGHRFTAENLIINELPKVLSYFMQDNIKYTAYGKPLDGTLKKMQKSCAVVEFLPGYEGLEGKARTAMIAGMLHNFEATNISIDTIWVIKELFTKRYLKLHTAPFILMQLKGWGYLNDYDRIDTTEKKFVELLKQLIPDKWISAKNLHEFINCRLINLQPISDAAADFRIYYETDNESTANYNYRDKNYASTQKKLLLNIPFINGTIFLYAAFGLIEIAYEDIDATELGKTYYSPYDGLKYLKLTALGAYVLDKTQTYESANAQPKNKLQLSEESLIILAEGDIAVLDVMLSNFAEKAGPNRYKVSHGYFLKNCQSKVDLDKKIALFKKTIATELPIYWNLQFINWQLNGHKIIEDIATRVFKIAADDKQLQKLIVQDAVLKVLISKAEQFQILVANAKVPKFKLRMKELGYLVE